MQINPDVFTIAAKLDEERDNGKIRGPLHGIPFVAKDNIGTKDRMETTSGSWALLGSIVPRDAFVIRQLREAGAVLLGKAALSEWADMRSNNYSEGYSGRGGQCRSAYNLTVNPGVALGLESLLVPTLSLLPWVRRRMVVVCGLLTNIAARCATSLTVI